jgi:hypothetical protein
LIETVGAGSPAIDGSVYRNLKIHIAGEPAPTFIDYEPRRQNLFNNQYLAGKYPACSAYFAPFAAPGSLSPWLAGGPRTEQATSPVRFVAQAA